MGFFQRLSRYVDDVLLLPDEVRGLVEEAQRRLDDGDAAEALVAASKALATRRDHPQILAVAGEALARLGEHGEAERLLREAIEVDPDFGPARVFLGRLLLATGRPDDAAAELRQAVPRLVGAGDKTLAAEALVLLSRCHVALGRPDRAARELRKAVALGADDLETHLALARALVEVGGEEGAARAAARRAAALAAGPVAAPVLARVGEVVLDAGLAEEAAPLLERALAGGAAAHLPLARAALARGDLMTAHDHALRALADDPFAAEPHRVRARLALKTGDYEAASRAFEAAIAAEPGDVPTLRLALATASRLDLARAGAIAEVLRRAAPDDPAAQAALARRDVATGRLETAERLVRAVTQQAPDLVESWLGAAELAIAQGRGEDALAALERAEVVEAGRREIEALGQAACRLVAAGGTSGEPDLYDVLERAHGLLARSPGGSESAVEVARIREDYDKPLLLTVMGEFNAGKSTFINALVGEPVAPMGITPTTATINVLKYGPERKVRVLHRSGVIKELDYDALGAWLKGLSRQAAVEVRQVEILYPAEELTRVNLVDTPGFNSIVTEHEQVARQFLERADAVVWLFDAGQPGKDSEREALERVAAAGKQVLGVLNKADRLPPAALDKVLAHLEAQELVGLVGGVVPLSARTALEAKTGGVVDDAALARSGLAELERRLDETFYSRARLIKRAGCAARLVAVLDRAVAAETAANAELRRASAAVDDALARLGALRDAVVEATVAPVGEELKDLWRTVASEAAREVLEFVRPRRHALESHRWSAEDREYLVELVEGRLVSAMAELAGPLAGRAAAALEPLWSDMREVEPGVIATDLAATAEAGELARDVTWSMLAFLRGLVLGGRADRFFDDELPRVALEEAELARRIERWWRGAEGHLRRELQHGADELFGRLSRRLGAESSRLRAELASRRRAGLRPLSGFAALAREWARSP